MNCCSLDQRVVSTARAFALAGLATFATQSLAGTLPLSDSAYLDSVNEMVIEMPLAEIAGQTYLPISADAQDMLSGQRLPSTPKCNLEMAEAETSASPALCPESGLSTTLGSGS